MIVYINSRFLTQPITGVQRYAQELVSALDRYVVDNPDDTRNITYIGLAPHKIQREWPCRKIALHQFGFGSGHFWEHIELPLYLKRQHHHLLLNLANTGPYLGGDMIVTVHDLGFMINPGWYSLRFARFYRILIPRLVRRAKIVLTVSAFSKDELIRLLGTPGDKIHVIPCGVSSMMSPTRDADFTNHFGRYILAVSSIDPRKNFKKIIAAFQALDIPGINLVIAGGTSRLFAHTGLEDAINNDPRIHLTGRVTDDQLLALYSDAAAFVFPSLYEGFGLPPLEAMACGCPCVVSDIASLPEVCGDAVLYCEPSDINSIVNQLRRLLTDDILAGRLREKGIAQAKKFNWDDSAALLHRIVSSEITG